MIGSRLSRQLRAGGNGLRLAMVVAAAVAAAGASARAGEIPPGGGLKALPTVRTRPLALTNAGFEDELTGWQGARVFSVVQNGAKEGRKCLRYDSAVPFGHTPSMSQGLSVKAPGIYRLRFWIKTGKLTPVRRGGGVRVSICYTTRGGGRGWPSTKVFSGTADWKLVEHRVALPAKMDPDSATVAISRYAGVKSGEAYFDAFTLERELPPDVEAYLMYPNYRGFLPADGPRRVRVWVKVNDPKAKVPARIVVTKAGGERVGSVSLPAGTTEKVVEIDAAKWPLGTYELTAHLGEYAYPAYVIRKISAEQRKAFGVWIDPQNVLHVGGKPTFPIGFYNTVKKFGVINDAEIARLDMMAQAPANACINYTWWNCSLADRKRYLGEMHRRGIWYLDTLMPFGRPGTIRLKADERFAILKDLLPGSQGLKDRKTLDHFTELLAKRMREFPGHGGWYVMDERPFSMVPSIFHQYTVLRAADPDHPTFLCSNKPGEMYFWRDAADVFGLDAYPLFNMAAGRPLSLAGNWTRAGIEATHGSRPVWTVIQFFQGWSKDRWPTTEELRSMSLMAVVEGARGLFYWSFGNKGIQTTRANKRQEYWQRAVTVTRELKSLTPALLAPDAPQIVASVSDPRIRWRARATPGKWTVFAYLPARKFAERQTGQAVAVTFKLKDGRTVRKTFKPDTADWFEVPAAGG